jgi:hypothetical protein
MRQNRPVTDGRLLLYLNLLAASVVDLAVLIALVRTGPGHQQAALALVLALLPALLVPAVVLHRRLVQEIA